MRFSIKIFILSLLLAFTMSIQFSYTLKKRYMECFYESAQKGTRYQIDIRANSTYYHFQVSQQQIVHADPRNNQFYKYFAAFAKSDAGISFCITSLADDPISLDIQFYHGFYLQDDFELKNANQFVDMTRRMEGVTEMIKMNYQKYQKMIIQRQSVSQRIKLYASWSALAFLFIVALVKVIYYRKAVKFMRARKVI